MQLTKVNKIGMWYGHFYELNGVQDFQECSEAEYLALGLPGAGAPKTLPEGATWLNSGCIEKFDTESGLMEDNTFAVRSTEQSLVCTGGKMGMVASDQIDESGNLAVETVFI